MPEARRRSHLPDPKDLALLHPAGSDRTAGGPPRRARAASRGECRAGLMGDLLRSTQASRRAAVGFGTPGPGSTRSRTADAEPLDDADDGALGIARVSYRRSSLSPRECSTPTPCSCDSDDRYAERVSGDDALAGAMAARTRPGLRPAHAARGRTDAHRRRGRAATALGGADSATPVVRSRGSPARWLTIAFRAGRARPRRSRPTPALVENAGDVHGGPAAHLRRRARRRAGAERRGPRPKTISRTRRATGRCSTSPDTTSGRCGFAPTTPGAGPGDASRACSDGSETVPLPEPAAVGGSCSRPVPDSKPGRCPARAAARRSPSSQRPAIPSS